MGRLSQIIQEAPKVLKSGRGGKREVQREMGLSEGQRCNVRSLRTAVGFEGGGRSHPPRNMNAL